MSRNISYSSIVMRVATDKCTPCPYKPPLVPKSLRISLMLDRQHVRTSRGARTKGTRVRAAWGSLVVDNDPLFSRLPHLLSIFTRWSSVVIAKQQNHCSLAIVSVSRNIACFVGYDAESRLPARIRQDKHRPAICVDLCCKASLYSYIIV